MHCVDGRRLLSVQQATATTRRPRVTTPARSCVSRSLQETTAGCSRTGESAPTGPGAPGLTCAQSPSLLHSPPLAPCMCSLAGPVRGWGTLLQPPPHLPPAVLSCALSDWMESSACVLPLLRECAGELPELCWGSGVQAPLPVCSEGLLCGLQGQPLWVDTLESPETAAVCPHQQRGNWRFDVGNLSNALKCRCPSGMQVGPALVTPSQVLPRSQRPTFPSQFVQTLSQAVLNLLVTLFRDVLISLSFQMASL